MHKFTVKELAQEINASEAAIYKRIKRQQLKTLKEMSENRMVAFISLSGKELEELKQEIEKKKVVKSPSSKPKKVVVAPQELQFEQVFQFLERYSNQICQFCELLSDVEKNKQG